MSNEIEDKDGEHYCPRCLQDWFDDDGEHQHGTAVPSDCEECEVCKDCEHLLECSKSK